MKAIQANTYTTSATVVTIASHCFASAAVALMNDATDFTLVAVVAVLSVIFAVAVAARMC